MSTDFVTARFARIALVVAVIVTTTAIGTRVWRDRTSPPVAAGTPAGADTLIATLETRLQASPDDAESWRLLAGALFQARRFDKAAIAYRRLATLAPANADHWSSLGEALVLAGPGDVPGAALTAFAKAVAIDPKEPRARYFLGVARDIKGDHRGAIADWLALLGDTPAGAPWDADVRRTIEQVATKHGIDVAGQLAALRPDPAAATARPSRSGAAAASAVQQTAMIAARIDGLAAKLEADPTNVEGWMMLMRNYVALGRMRDAQAARTTALAANPGSAAEIEQAARELAIPR